MRSFALITALLFVVSCKDRAAKPALGGAAGAAEALPASVNFPKVSGAAPLLSTFPGPVLVATPSGIVVEGKSIVSLVGSEVDPSEKDGGALGLKISRLTDFLGQLPKEPGRDRLILAMDREHTYKLLIEIIFSAKHKAAGFRDFVLVARHGTDQVGIPLRLPDKKPPAIMPPEPADPSDPPLKLVVAITKSDIIVWSISGLEGTLAAPRAKWALTEPDVMKKLNDLLGQIAKNRWGGKPRPENSYNLMVMADGPIKLQTIAEVFVAVRQTPDGKERLFPDIELSTGFE